MCLSFNMFDPIKEVSAKRKRLFEECQQLMSRDKNFASFRERLSATIGCCIPFFGSA